MRQKLKERQEEQERARKEEEERKKKTQTLPNGSNGTCHCVYYVIVCLSIEFS